MKIFKKDSELRLPFGADNQTLSEEQVKFVYEKLDDFYTFKLEKESPFDDFFDVLTEIGKKLDWHTVTAQAVASSLSSFSSSSDKIQIEDKLSYLLKLKSKNDKQVNNSLLTKQISFYGIALFFKKLIEFQSIANELFNNRLIMIKTYQYKSLSDAETADGEKIKKPMPKTSEPFDIAMSNLVYCIKLWQRFNQQKDFLTIVSKCLSNSKLDNLGFYKTFISDFYNVATQSTPTQSAQSWESLKDLEMKPRIVALANLFMQEKEKIHVTTFSLIFLIFFYKLKILLFF